MRARKRKKEYETTTMTMEDRRWATGDSRWKMQDARWTVVDNGDPEARGANGKNMKGKRKEGTINI